MAEEPEHYTARPLPPPQAAPGPGQPGAYWPGGHHTGGHPTGGSQPGGYPFGGHPYGEHHPGMFLPGGHAPWGPPQSAPQPMSAGAPGRRSVLLAYVLWFFLGWLGAHKFYLAQPVQGTVYILITLIGWATTPILIGWLILMGWAVLMVVDVVLIPIRVTYLNGKAARG